MVVNYHKFKDEGPVKVRLAQVMFSSFRYLCCHKLFVLRKILKRKLGGGGILGLSSDNYSSREINISITCPYEMSSIFLKLVPS